MDNIENDGFEALIAYREQNPAKPVPPKPRTRLPKVRQPLEYENPACATVGDPDSWFEEAAENTAAAVRICKTCDHQVECADFGINNEVLGIWGGLSTKERANIANRRGIIRIPLVGLQPTPVRGNKQ